MSDQDYAETPASEAAPANVPAEQSAAPAEPTEARVNLVKQWLKDIHAAKKHWDKPFCRMREDADFAYKWGVGKQWDGQTDKDDRYIANVVQRHITSRVAALYAKNPTVVARPKKRREFRIWDGTAEMLQPAMMAAQQAMTVGLPPPPDVQELLSDVQEGLLRRKMVEAVGETLEILYTYFTKEQVPNDKDQMKQLVRRVETCGVGYVTLNYQRMYAPRPDKASRLADIVDQMQALDRMRADAADGKVEEHTAKYEEMRLALKNIQSEPEVIVREGLVKDYPRSDRIIPDKRCVNIQGFIGCRWVAEEFDWTVDEIKEMYGKDVKKAAQESVARETIWGRADTEINPDTVPVWKVYDRKTGLMYTLCDCYEDFLEEPRVPDVKVEQFIPIYALVFNAVEHPTDIFPPSDVRLLRSQQIEYNRIKEALRQHRIANRPLYAYADGALDDEDVDENAELSLSNYPAHAALALKGMNEGDKIGDKLQAVPKVNVDPNLYETEGVFSDMERVTGSQEANLGGTSGATATETTVAEGSRVSSLQSNADDLDGLLTKLARDGGQILLMECSAETVFEIVGPGAVWPEMTRIEIVKELYLDVEAGSSGRPNKAMEIANFERMGPLMMQMPGMDPDKMARYAWKIMDDRIDPNDMLSFGLPSITAMNGMKQIGTGDPATDPNAQGPQGGNNTAAPPRTAPGPAAPAPSDLVMQK